MTRTGGLLADIRRTLHQEIIELDLLHLQWIIDVRDLPSMRQGSDKCHIMKVSGFPRYLHQENIEQGLRLQPFIDPGLQMTDLREIRGLPTKEIPIPETETETDLERDQITEQITLQTDTKVNPDLLIDIPDHRLLEDPGLRYPEPDWKIAGLRHHPVSQAEEPEAITSQEAMGQHREQLVDTTLNLECLRHR